MAGRPKVPEYRKNNIRVSMLEDSIMQIYEKIDCVKSKKIVKMELENIINSQKERCKFVK